jgi:hypothetical protein
LVKPLSNMIYFALVGILSFVIGCGQRHPIEQDRDFRKFDSLAAISFRQGRDVDLLHQLEASDRCIIGESINN